MKTEMNPATQSQSISKDQTFKRRTIIQGAAWSIPVIAMAAAAPAAAGSGEPVVPLVVTGSPSGQWCPADRATRKPILNLPTITARNSDGSPVDGTFRVTVDPLMRWGTEADGGGGGSQEFPIVDGVGNFPTPVFGSPYGRLYGPDRHWGLGTPVDGTVWMTITVVETGASETITIPIYWYC